MNIIGQKYLLLFFFFKFFNLKISLNLFYFLSANSDIKLFAYKHPVIKMKLPIKIQK